MMAVAEEGQLAHYNLGVSMTAVNNQINIAGKATTYNAVSNFYDALQGSGHFADVGYDQPC